MKTLGSVAAVVAAVREEAMVEVERLERETAAAIAALDGEIDAISPREDGDARLLAARARVREEELQRDWSEGLEDLQDRERWMSAVVAAARQALAAPAGRDATRHWIRDLVIEAAGSLPAGPCVAVVPADALVDLDERWRAGTAERIGRELSIEAGPLSAGCIVRLRDRPVAYDNSLDARERRTETEWRAALARVYAGAVSRAPARASVVERSAADGAPA